MDLLNRCRAGEEQAFTQLFHRYKNLVYKAAYLMLNNTVEAEDVLQEVFTRVHRSIDRYDPSRGAFTSWLYRITLNQCLNRRRKKRPPVVPLDEIPAAAMSNDLPSHAERLEESDTLEQAVRGLSEKQRAIVILRYYADLSYAEIGEILDIPIGTVKSRLNLAMTTLRRVLVAPPDQKGTAKRSGQRREE